MFKKIICSIIFCYGIISGFSQTCPEVVVLPADSRWGGGDQQGSVLIGNTYGPGQGPGMYIVADGGYRLYLNGELLAYDNAAGRVRFIPMTFLPGRNAVSVVGVNGAGAPGIMLHIDELHQSFVTDNSWKFTRQPADNTWKNKNYNSSSWTDVTVQSAGNLTKTPGGQTISGFPAGSPARWIWTSGTDDAAAVFRFTFDLKPAGFGAATTGGEGGSIVVVKTVSDLISQAQSNGAKIILVEEGAYDFRSYRDQQTCYVPCNSSLNTYKGDFVDLANNCPGTVRTVQRWDRRIGVRSDKTIIGMGRGVSLRGASFYTSNPTSNVIWRNLKIWDVNPHIIEAGDGITPNDATKVWVDHCTFKWISDGNDINRGKEQTWSWNYVQGDNEFMCSKRDHYAAALDYSDVTYDHVYWENCEGRNPKCSQYNRVHMLNNYHKVNTYYAVGSAKDSEVRIEGTVFQDVRYPTNKENTGKIYSVNNQYNSIGSHRVDNRNASEPKDAVFSVPYAYSVESLNTVAQTVSTHARAGGKWGTLPAYNETAGLYNKAPVVSILVPADGSVLSDPATLTITAVASDQDGTISKVEFYNGTLKLGEATTAPYTCTMTSLSSCSYSLVAVARDNSGNATMSWPVTVTVNQQPATYIYVYDNSGNHNWDYTGSWTPAALPARRDTAVIRTGEIHVSGHAVEAETRIEQSGIVKVVGESSMRLVKLQGGRLSVYTGGNGAPLTAGLYVETNSGISVGSGSHAILTLNGSIAGSGELKKTGAGLLRVSSDASAYEGNWRVSEGKVHFRTASSIGAGIVYIDGGEIETDMISVIRGLEIPNGKLILHADLTTGYAKNGDIYLAAGQYTAADLPEYITGSGILIVEEGPDCSGVFGGGAAPDACGECSGGQTGKIPNACMDCNGDREGTAYPDDCGICVGGLTGFEACSDSLEAEYACEVDGILLEDRNGGFSGNGYVNTTNSSDSYVTWLLESDRSGKTTITFRYANAGTVSRDGRIIINGAEVGLLQLPSTGSWSDWRLSTVLLDLKAGINELTLVSATEEGLANLDILYFSEGVSDGGCTITGISGTLPDQNISVYPNPTEGNIYWESEREWELLNVSGLSLAKGYGIGANLSQYPEGMYFIRLEGQFVKVIKK